MTLGFLWTTDSLIAPYRYYKFRVNHVDAFYFILQSPDKETGGTDRQVGQTDRRDRQTDMRDRQTDRRDRQPDRRDRV